MLDLLFASYAAGVRAKARRPCGTECKNAGVIRTQVLCIHTALGGVQNTSFGFLPYIYKTPTHFLYMFTTLYNSVKKVNFVFYCPLSPVYICTNTLNGKYIEAYIFAGTFYSVNKTYPIIFSQI